MTTPHVVIYTTMFCPYCQNAKVLLTRKKIAFTEISIDGDRAGREAMRNRACGRNTVPQIFFGDRHIGGCDELYALDQAGKLDAVLLESAD